MSRRDIRQIHIRAIIVDQVHVLVREVIRIAFDQDFVEPRLLGQRVQRLRLRLAQHIQCALFDNHMADAAFLHVFDDAAQLLQTHRRIRLLTPKLIDHVKAFTLETVDELPSFIIAQGDVVFRYLKPHEV